MVGRRKTVLSGDRRAKGTKFLDIGGGVRKCRGVIGVREGKSGGINEGGSVGGPPTPPQE